MGSALLTADLHVKGTLLLTQILLTQDDVFGSPFELCEADFEASPSDDLRVTFARQFEVTLHCPECAPLAPPPAPPLALPAAAAAAPAPAAAPAHSPLTAVRPLRDFIFRDKQVFCELACSSLGSFRR